MQKIPSILFAMSVVIVFAFFITQKTLAQSSPFSFFSNALGDLEKSIEEKNNELQKIKEQRDSLQRSLDVVSEVGNSLKKDIQVYNTSINQLNLSIKSSAVNIEKLDMEIDVLGNDVRDMQDEIETKQIAIGRLIGEIQQADNESFIERILKSESLSESIAQAESIKTLNSALSTSIKDLQSLRTEYKNKIESTKQKKGQKETQKDTLLTLQQITAEQKIEKQKILEVTKSQEQQYAKQLEELDKRQEEIGNAISEIEDRLRTSFNPNLLPIQRFGVLNFPLESPYVTQCYGKTPSALKLYKTKSHNGLDLGTPVGTPVFAAESGKIAKVGNNDRGASRWSKYQYGKYIVIKHDNNLATLYGHLSSQIVKEGAQVEKGALIGYSGNTGYSFGPHLHFGVLWAPTLQYKAIPPAAGVVPIGVTIDPATYLPSIAGYPHGRDSGCK
ncbi:MAG: peptidoglycan DD-metalloendopeptidase family protein [Candidatus Paceibacterota bacterium]|jgi:murein DD-endopeptidase MepM/ murein hydrolase activator NlpD